MTHHNSRGTNRGTKPRYTDEQRAQAVEAYRTHGPKAAARSTGIPESTIKGWAKRAGVSTSVVASNRAGSEAAAAKAALLREGLRLKLLEKANEVIDRISAEHVDFRVVPQGAGQGSEVERVVMPLPTPTGVREYAVAVGVLLDKYRLEMGEATDRSKRDVTVHHELSEEELDRNLERVFAGLHVVGGS